MNLRLPSFLINSKSVAKKKWMKLMLQNYSTPHIHIPSMTAPSKPMYFILSHFNFFSPALVTAQWHKFISSKWSPTHPLSMDAKNSSVTLVRAKFNFINGNWRIADAHSSVMPSFWFSSSASKRGQRPPMAVITASVTAATLLSCSARKLCSFPICLTRPETFKHLNKIAIIAL